ncbi:MAG TPA: SMC-Scp complex subunit ScpB [Alphaproteobacteria bacterium]|nr:SMC-Scp complex subunit ScpB [Alphaproteobacteria bacterium]
MTDSHGQNPDETELEPVEAAETASEQDAAPEASESELEPIPGDVDPLRLLEALLFAATSPLSEDELVERMPDGADIPALLAELKATYEHRGVHLVEAGSRWSMQTAPDLSGYLRVYVTRTRKLSRAAVETMAIVAYHQPITRAEIEEIRGVALSKGTLDQLFEAGWIHPKGRRETPGRPVTWATTAQFLTDFGLESLDALPGLEELKAAGLLDKRPAIQISEGLTPGEGEALAVSPLAAAEGTLEGAELAETVAEAHALASVEAAEQGEADDAEDEDKEFESVDDQEDADDADEDDDDEEFESDDEDDDSEDDDEFEDEDDDEDEDDKSSKH